MRYALWLCTLLAGGCASAEMGSRENDPANPSATVAAVDVGVGVLSSSFSPEQIAPAGAQDADPHAGHHHAPVAASTIEPAPEPPAPSVQTSAPRPIAKKAPRATTYTCTHHPEVVSAAKGKCPKCGMDLVPKQPASGGNGGH